MIPMSVTERISLAFSTPLIIPSANPKSDRMTYITYLRKHKLLEEITIAYKQNECRIIIGPKDFHIQIFLDLGICSQEQLDNAWKEKVSSLEDVNETTIKSETVFSKQIREYEELEKQIKINNDKLKDFFSPQQNLFKIKK